MEEKRYINIKIPKGSRKTFSLTYDIRSSVGRRYVLIEDERIESINERFKSGELTLSEARTEIDKIRESLLPQKKQFEDNQNHTNALAIKKLLVNFQKDRKKESQEAIELDYRRIMKILGKDSISTIEIPTLKQRIVSSHFSDSIKNRLIIFTNKLLLIQESGVRVLFLLME